MALSTISPALALLGIKGIGEEVTLCTPWMFQAGCLSISILFGLVIPWVILDCLGNHGIQKVLEDVVVTEAGDHMIVYAVAVILPLWAGEMGNNHEMLATACAFLLVWFLIASSNLHHANLYLRARGYRFFTASPLQASQGDSFLVLSTSDISGQRPRIFCNAIDGKVLVIRRLQSK